LNYEVFIERAAQRALARVARSCQERIIEALQDLGGQPRPAGAKKLRGREAWRIRLADYRVIYEIDDAQRRILVISVGHRRDVYRR